MNFLHPSLPGVFDHPLINDTTVNPSLWTLKIEVGFYLIIPLLMIWFRKSRRPWVALLIIYVLSILYRNVFNAYADYTHSDMPAFLARQLPGFMTYFAAGMAGYWYKEQMLRYKNYMILPALLVFAAEYYYAGIELLHPLAWGVIVLWCAYSLPIFNHFAKYGDISYGIYIYHGPILKILLSVGLFSAISLPYATIVYLISVLIIGFLSWHLLENKFLRRN
jgi:peptidoglycan/LPS O-acetylase OafA/YrhL